MIIDVFGDVAVVASSAAWVEKYRSEIEACLGKINFINHINWRPSVDILKEDGVNEPDLKEMHSSTCPERTKVCNDSSTMQTLGAGHTLFCMRKAKPEFDLSKGTGILHGQQPYYFLNRFLRSHQINVWHKINNHNK